MNILLNNLIELKENYNAIGIKSEFETEGATFEDVKNLKDLSMNSNLELTIKIGGCGAIRDIIQANELKVDSIVAPMIESEYALQKFITSVESVYDSYSIKPKLYINIETKTAIENISKICNNNYMESIQGIVLGRGDLAESLHIDNVENLLILNAIKNVYNEIKKIDKELIIGGKIYPESNLSIPNILSNKYETRKIIFNSLPSKAGITKAIEFEINWIEAKKFKNKIDEKRLNELKKRIAYF